MLSLLPEQFLHARIINAVYHAVDDVMSANIVASCQCFDLELTCTFRHYRTACKEGQLLAGVVTPQNIANDLAQFN